MNMQIVREPVIATHTPASGSNLKGRHTSSYGLPRRRLLAMTSICLLTFFYSISLFAYSPLSPYQNDELKKLEKEFVEQINASPQVIRDPLATEYINTLAHTLIKGSRVDEPIRFFIVKSADINAFAGPGGFIGVNSQLILATHNENELAAVMAHEIAHEHLHHLYQFIEHQKAMQMPMLASILASLALGIVNPTLASGALMASLSGRAQDNINFTRANEQQADRIGMQLLAGAGYSPKGMVTFFQTLQEQTRYSSAADIPTLLRTHPLDEDRITEALNRIKSNNDVGIKDSLSYALFKELVRVKSTNDPKALIDYYRTHKTLACQYGLVLTLLKSNQFAQAKMQANALKNQYPEQIDFALLLAESDMGLKNYSNALSLLNELHKNYPENYAITLNLALSLILSGQANTAYHLLLVANRQFKNDLILCKTLADSAAKDKQPGMAYFIEANCDLLRGDHRLALNHLAQAKKISKNNSLLQSRIDAKIEEIKGNQ